jgi:hypothetical protein
VSEVLEAIRAVNHFYEARPGNRKLSQIMVIAEHYKIDNGQAAEDRRKSRTT